MMSKLLRAAMLYVLWHHQGRNSPVGQPLRIVLGLGPSQHIPAEELAEANQLERNAALGAFVRERWLRYSEWTEANESTAALDVANFIAAQEQP